MEDSGAFARPGHSRGYKASTEEEDASMLRLGQGYTQQFSQFTNQDSVREVRKLLSGSELASFEIAQLGNMCCSDSVEAKSLIPSLVGKIDDESLDRMLKQMESIKNFQA
ncbi:hypothetical protein BB558_005960 [Smittium angustum]|uniref:RNA polymerase Rpb4/RPC9 core domain-containing protein n=1 Tax=Smittium angustum TaxID=133377 RepID=A0A2U1IZ18_SMIAN|nr:hypothetical protein BB558_005960 [Smittium angustum]